MIKEILSLYEQLPQLRKEEPAFVAGIILNDGSIKEQVAFLRDTKDGVVVRYKGGRIDFVPFAGISAIRLESITRNFQEPKGVSVAQGIPIERKTEVNHA